MKRKWLFPFLVILLLAPWPVVYAYDDGVDGAETIQIEAAQASAAPHWNAYGGVIGGVTNPGDLFYIDAIGEPVDILVTLHLTNADELIEYYRYLILKVGVYVQTGDEQWEPATGGNGELIPDTYITMRNGMMSFMLPGYTSYKIAIDSGSFYCIKAANDGSNLSPQFYLTVE